MADKELGEDDLRTAAGHIQSGLAALELFKRSGCTDGEYLTRAWDRISTAAGCLRGAAAAFDLPDPKGS